MHLSLKVLFLAAATMLMALPTQADARDSHRSYRGGRSYSYVRSYPRYYGGSYYYRRPVVYASPYYYDDYYYGSPYYYSAYPRYYSRPAVSVSFGGGYGRYGYYGGRGYYGGHGYYHRSLAAAAGGPRGRTEQNPSRQAFTASPAFCWLHLGTIARKACAVTKLRLSAIALAAAFASSAAALAEEGLSSYQAIVSVADQKIAVLRDGQVVAKFPISTSKFGVGDASGSYKTPLGKLKVCEKLGDNLPTGAVIKHRRATGEVINVNAPGRDPIVTRILWLDGQEAGNARAKDRSIYIHGTPEEKLIGRPASYGCIRMRSQDVIALYNELGVGSTVSIVPDKLPHLANYTPPKPTPAPVIAKVTPPAPAVEKPAPATSPKVLAAIAEAKDRDEKAARLKEEREKADREVIAARIAQVEKEKAAAPVAKNEKKPAPVAVAKVEKIEKTPALTLAPAPIAASTRVASRKVKEEPRPVVPMPVDQDRLNFLKNREAALASVRFPSDMSVRADGSISTGSNMDASDRLKGSILDAGLPTGLRPQ